MTTEEILYMIAAVLLGIFIIARMWPRVRDQAGHYVWEKHLTRIRFVGVILLTLMAIIFLIIGLAE